MKFQKFLSKRGAASALSKETGLSNEEISMFKTGKRKPPPHAAVLIEVATNGKVTRKDLRPSDWKKYWPELS